MTEYRERTLVVGGWGNERRTIMIEEEWAN